MKKLLIAIFAIVATFALTGCKPIDVVGITLSETSVEIDAGQSYTLTASVSPSDASDKTVLWSSSDESVATVENGVISAIKAGSVTISATSANGKVATCAVIVPQYFSVTFDFANGSESQTETVKEGNTVQAKQASKTAYDFIGWFIGEEEWDFDTEIASDITLSAKWSATAYQITYDLDGGTVAARNPQSYTVESEEIMLNAPTKRFYTFDGWQNERGETVEKIVQGSSGNISLKAKWSYVGFEFLRVGEMYKIVGIDGAMTEITTPSEYKGLPVTAIGSHAVSNTSQLKSLVISDGITTMDEYAFWNCSALTTLKLPSTTSKLNKSLFWGCSSLKTLTIPAIVSSIRAEAFSNCRALETVVIEEGTRLYNINNGAFFSCINLKSINLPKGITSIGKEAFYGCTKLNLTMPDKVRSIGYSAFYNCKSLTDVTLPDTLTSIGHSAFYGCEKIESINIPYKVKEIKEMTFMGCTKLKTITLAGGITNIGYSAFKNCSSLQAITLSSALSLLGEGAFQSCTSLQYIVLPSSLKSIGSSVFRGCESLTVYCEAEIKPDLWLDDWQGDATAYWYSEAEPSLNADQTAYEGNWWRYVSDLPTVWKYEN